MVSARSAGICTCSRSPSSFTTSTLWVRGACACVRRGSTGAAGEAEGDERDMGRIYAVPLPKEVHGASESGKSTYCDHHKKAALHQVGAALFDSGTVAGVRTWALTQLRAAGPRRGGGGRGARGRGRGPGAGPPPRPARGGAPPPPAPGAGGGGGFLWGGGGGAAAGPGPLP